MWRSTRCITTQAQCVSDLPNPEGWHHVANYTAVETPEYHFELEEFQDDAAPPNQMVFAHIRLRQPITASILKDMKRTFALFREHVSCPLFAIAEEDDEKWEHFVGYFGFRFLTKIIYNNGVERRLFWLPPIRADSGKEK